MYASKAERNSGLNLSIDTRGNGCALFLPDVIGDSKIDTNLRNN
jgi:hypothetical protein